MNSGGGDGGSSSNLVVMEQDELREYALLLGGWEKNISICTDVSRIHSKGIFVGNDILSFSFPLLLLQLFMASGIILLLSFLLKPLRQPIIVRQLLGGLLLGSSFICHTNDLKQKLFPLRGFVALDAISSFGFIFYFFTLGIKSDPCILKKIERKAISLGFFTVAVPMVLSTATSLSIAHHFKLDPELGNSLPAVALSESALAFPIVAHFLSELKILNSEFGRLALTSSVVSTLCSFCVITTTILYHESSTNRYAGLYTLRNSVILIGIILFVLRPLVVRTISKVAEGESLKERDVITILLIVLLLGYASHASGLHLYFGPLVFGLALPAGPPIGSTVIDKLELITNWLLLPIFFVKNGLVIDIFSVKFKSYVVVQFVALVSVFGKFVGAFLVALFCNVPVKDAASLGLMMNAQGVLELGMFKMMRRNGAINNDALVVMMTSTVLVTGIITPIIKFLSDPSRRYAVYRRRTVMHSRPNSELRVLICIHDQEDVPMSVNLLEALNPTQRSPLSVYIIHLMELVGRANPLVIPHKQNKTPSKKAKTSESIVNAYRYFESSNNGIVTVYPFTAISPTKTMHDDVCSMALGKRTNLVVVPFYKKFQSSGQVGSYRKVVRTTNNNILNKAPCSVAILVSRGLVNTSRPTLDSWTSYRVAVLFLGGPDDREALAIGARMAGHQNVSLTLLRLLENGNIASHSAAERRLDNEMVSEFRTTMAGNYRVMYIEEVIMDGNGTMSVIKSMEKQFEVVLVGRHHDDTSPLLTGLTDWNDHKDLGTVGDVLASAAFMGTATLLVVQQHNNVVSSRNLSAWNVVHQENEETPIRLNKLMV